MECRQQNQQPTPHHSSQPYTSAALPLLTQAVIRPLSKLIQFHELAEKQLSSSKTIFLFQGNKFSCLNEMQTNSTGSINAINFIQQV